MKSETINMETANQSVMISNMHQYAEASDLSRQFCRRSITRPSFAGSVALALMLGLVSGHAAWGQAGQGAIFAEKTRHVQPVSEGEDAGAFQINAAVKTVETQPVPIQGGKPYVISIMARVDSDFVVEKNDRAISLTLDTFRHATTSTYSVVFIDQNNQPISTFGYGGSGFFLTQNWYAYKLPLHTPPNAVAIKLQISPARRNVFVRDLQATPYPNPDAVLLTQDFSLGELNYAGWTPSREGRLLTRPDGSVVFKPGYGGSSAIFPLEAGASYSIKAKGIEGRINMVYYDEAGKTINNRFLIRPTEKGENTVNFTPPEGTRFGKLLTYGITALESCHIVKESGAAQ
jgi:hypothetical protein